MELLIPSASSTTADRSMSLDIDAVASEEFNNDVTKLVMKTDKALVQELAPETPREVSERESLRCEEIVDAPVPQMRGQIDDVMQLIPQEGISERINEKSKVHSRLKRMKRAKPTAG